MPSCDGDGIAPYLARNKLVLATELGIGDSFALQIHVPELACTGESRTERKAGVYGARLREPRAELEGSGTRTVSDEMMDFEYRTHEILESNAAHTFSKWARFLIPSQKSVGAGRCG